MSPPKPDMKHCPYMMDFILHHRTARNQMYRQMEHLSSGIGGKVGLKANLSIQPTFMSCEPVVDLKYPEIFLKDMSKSKERVYSGRTLVLTIIDDPMLGFSAVNFVVEDKNRDVTRLSIYELPHDQSTCEKYSFGTVLGVVNPYLRIAPLDGKYGVRVDDPKTILHVGRKKDMCRYCGEENATKKCAECKRQYCNRHCQTEDWKYLQHKMVCKTPAVWAVEGVPLPASFLSKNK